MSKDKRRRAERGDTVVVSYIGTLDNGRIFASSDESGPLRFTIGNGDVFPLLEEAVVGMCPQEAKNVEIPAADAYGPRLEENLLRVDRSIFPAEREIRIAEKISITFADGTAKEMRAREVTESTVLLDGNHPLAGCDLTFAIRLDRTEDRDASP